MIDIAEQDSREIIKNQAKYIETLSRVNEQFYSVVLFLIDKNGGSIEIPESHFHKDRPGKLETYYDPVKQSYISSIKK